MSGKASDLIVSKAGWVKFKEVVSPRGKISKALPAKYKSWKDVWLTLRKSGNSNCLNVFSDSVKASSFTTEGYNLSLEDVCGFEIGEFEGMQHVLAIITRHVTYLIAPSDRKERGDWTDRIAQLFEEQSLFYVTIRKNCPIREGPAELRLLSTSVILTGDQPPVCLGKWLISDIRRYGAGKDFVFEVSQRCEEDKKTIFKLATSEPEVIKKQVDEMARSSSVVGQSTRQPAEKTKSYPSPRKTPLFAAQTTSPHHRHIDYKSSAPLHSISDEKTLNYADVQFSTSPSPYVHQSPHTCTYAQVDIATVEALSRTAKQNEGDKKVHAQEMAKKLGPRYENSGMWSTQSKQPLENEWEGEESKNFRRSTDLPMKQPDDVFQPQRTSTDVPGITSSEFSRQNYENLTLHDVPYPSGDYENVPGNYENILFASTSTEQEKGLHSN